MAYLGRKGASAPLTSADIPAGSVSAVKVASDVATQAELDAQRTNSSITTLGTVTSGVLEDAVTYRNINQDLASTDSPTFAGLTAPLKFGVTSTPALILNLGGPTSTGAYTSSFTLTAAQAPLNTLVMLEIQCYGGSSTPGGQWTMIVTQNTYGTKASQLKTSSQGYSDGFSQLICPIIVAADRAFYVNGYVTSAVSVSTHNPRKIQYRGYLITKG